MGPSLALLSWQMPHANGVLIHYAEGSCPISARVKDLSNALRHKFGRRFVEAEENHAAGGRRATPIDKFPEILIKRSQQPFLRLSYCEHRVIRAAPRGFANPKNIVAALAQSSHAVAGYVFIRT
jgi:hypothetical protein